MENGSCETCPPYHEINPYDAKECQLKYCGELYKVTKDAKCEECPLFERAQDDGQNCGSDQCNESQILQKDGTCTNVGPKVNPNHGVLNPD